VSVSLSVEGPGDAELISAVRGGDVDSYGELFARHVDAARRLARQLAGPADADDLVSDAFTKVLLVLQRGGGPDLAFRAYLLTAVRRLHVDKIRAGSRLRPVDDLTPFDPGLPFQDTAVEGFDNAAAARAFGSLPERWQMVLWHTEVEQQKPADIAPLLGMSANSVSALAYRAREGLRQAFLSQHATDPDDVDCAWTRDHLGAYVRGGLSRRDATRVDDHLAECRACAAVYLELTEVNSGLGALLAPLLLGSAGAGYLSSGGAGTGVLSGGFAAAKTWAASHASVTAVAGMAVTATAVFSIYGATHFNGHPAADLGSPPALGGPAVASTLPAGGDDQHRSPSTRARDRGPSTDVTTRTAPALQPTVPSTAPSTAPTSPAGPTTAPTTTGPSDPTSSAPTDPTSSGPTDPTSSPTDPTSSPTDPTTTPTAPVTTPITFASHAPVDPKFGDTYVVTATGGSGGRIVFTVDSTTTNAACSISGSTVTFDHAGTCVIAADEAPAASRSGQARAAGTATTALQQIDVPQESQAIRFTSTPPDHALVKDTYLVSAVSEAGIADISTSAECSISGSTVTFDHAGTCVITAAHAETSDFFEARPVIQSVQVEPTPAFMTIDATSVPLNGNGQQRLTVTVDGLPEGAKAKAEITFPSSSYVNAQSNDQSNVCAPTVIADNVYDCDVTQANEQTFIFDFTVNKGRQEVLGVLTPEGDLTLDPLSKTTFDLILNSEAETSTIRSFTLRTQQ
jgi:RNA polymerase sigma factor (sigma-70 family)